MKNYCRDVACIVPTVFNNILLQKGLVIKSTGSRYRVLYGEGKIIDCTIKGKFRVRELRTTNPVAVGDNIIFEFDTYALKISIGYRSIGLGAGSLF